MPIRATLYTDPGCPWAYSAVPAQSVIRWRYGDQLQWRLVTIGLTDNVDRYVREGRTPARSTLGYLHYRDTYGMPFSCVPRERIIATGLACRVIVAARSLAPGREWEVLRALQFAWFNTTLLLDRGDEIAQALRPIADLDVDAIVAAADDAQVLDAYEQDKRLARSADGGAAQLQGKTRQTDGPVRFSAPSLIFEQGELSMQAGGFQPAEAYDVLIANLDPSLSRRDPPSSPLEALQQFPAGLCTQEIAAIMAHNNQPPDRRATESALIELLGAGEIRRTALGNDALFTLAA